ncbi:nascent polypeptide-associated complex subunit alpha, muscle-specific form-like [Panicum virgatum]|uniref:nascent polypeptide-associated complex subunit alpha, muscle-specific form-like n=1 Tax=Panicum virgatum TaxID=38727 RepID=UPI0019D613F2|nr:nascent polypeptide-associated complex subunit alpha, muscle-specific form-like [Panicum virgatum]
MQHSFAPWILGVATSFVLDAATSSARGATTSSARPTPPRAPYAAVALADAADGPPPGAPPPPRPAPAQPPPLLRASWAARADAAGTAAWAAWAATPPAGAPPGQAAGDARAARVEATRAPWATPPKPWPSLSPLRPGAPPPLLLLLHGLPSACPPADAPFAAAAFRGLPIVARAAPAEAALAAALLVAKSEAAESQERIRAAALTWERERSTADALTRRVADAKHYFLVSSGKQPVVVPFTAHGASSSSTFTALVAASPALSASPATSLLGACPAGQHGSGGRGA